MRKSLTAATMAAILSVLSAPAQAVPVTITGYDVTSANPSGAGFWYYGYSGTVTPTRGTVSLTGGTGTMADGVFTGTGGRNTQLFHIAPAAAVITLYFDQAYSLNTIDIYGGSHGAGGNSIPGAITGFNLTIGGSTDYLATTGFGPINPRTGNLINDRASVVGSPLAGLTANSISLFAFTASEFRLSNRFSIAEIIIDGTAAAASVTEPGPMSLLGVGLVVTGALRRRRR